MGDDIGSGLSSMSVCFDFHPLITQLNLKNLFCYTLPLIDLVKCFNIGKVQIF